MEWIVTIPPSEDGGGFRGTAADIHDHTVDWLAYGKIGSNGCGHGLFDRLRHTCANMKGGVKHGVIFHRRDRYTHDDARLDGEHRLIP